MKNYLRLIAVGLSLLPLGVCAKENQETAKLNYIVNGDFKKKGISPWKIFSINEVSKPEYSVSDGVLTIKVTEPSEKYSNRQMVQPLEALKSGETYLLKFEAMASTNNSTLVGMLSRSKDFGKGHYGFRKNFVLGKEWGEYKARFTTKSFDEGNPPQLKFLFGFMGGTIQFKNIRLMKVEN
ncbi:Carbohydrate binding domain-containing protein [Rubritalea squalenifaciens DSM 18772]|uniref:Carbohydrate binding domain-containing protein n=1 Tax=Rubritalea squalenifaciens DSM 18772 TaxID=1123071 RepID=A0A1M6NTX4_9BACT|nr:carbohydrate binding domain-containing protein [Rubritalea squalenifaciens]SHJ99135.1 Carbohydrate binding domain-containing protein [Rubritalea squalenifaciens DSM 18772]